MAKYVGSITEESQVITACLCEIAGVMRVRGCTCMEPQDLPGAELDIHTFCGNDGCADGSAAHVEVFEVRD